MKTLSIIVLAMLINLQSKACHLDTLGWCSGKTYFKTAIFNNGSIFQFRIQGDTDLLFTYTTKASGSTDTVFTAPQATQSIPVTIEFRYKYITDTAYNGWQSTVSGTGVFAGCGSLDTKFTSIDAVTNGNIVNVVFNNSDESQVKIASYIPSATCVFIAGLSDGLRDASLFRMDGYNNWWNGKQSWLNKYKNRDINQGAAFWGSTTIFVAITDAPHASNILTHQADNMATLLMPVDNNRRFWHLMAKAGIMTLDRTLGHYIIYDIIFKPQGRD